MEWWSGGVVEWWTAAPRDGPVFYSRNFEASHPRSATLRSISSCVSLPLASCQWGDNWQLLATREGARLSTGFIPVKAAFLASKRCSHRVNSVESSNRMIMPVAANCCLRRGGPGRARAGPNGRRKVKWRAISLIKMLHNVGE